MRTFSHVLLRANDQSTTELPTDAIKSAGSAATSLSAANATVVPTVATRRGSESATVQSSLATVS